MNLQSITCSFCGYQFDPAQQSLPCRSCPLSAGCSLACCPECGYEMVNIQQSGLARWAGRLFSRTKSLTQGCAEYLAEVRPGGKAKISGYGQGLRPDQLAHLQAYGVVPGRTVWVLQQSPVTIIQVEHTELVMENEMAGLIRVESLEVKTTA